MSIVAVGGEGREGLRASSSLHACPVSLLLPVGTGHHQIRLLLVATPGRDGGWGGWVGGGGGGQTCCTGSWGRRRGVVDGIIISACLWCLSPLTGWDRAPSDQAIAGGNTRDGGGGGGGGQTGCTGSWGKREGLMACSSVHVCPVYLHLL